MCICTTTSWSCRS